MHEMPIAQRIVDVVKARAAACHAARVKSVRLKIGEASGIAADSLALSFETLASPDPLLAGAQLLIDMVPHRAYCRHCASEFAVANLVMQCPQCAGWETEVISGAELQILEIEVEET